jgi:hypothetical protein
MAQKQIDEKARGEGYTKRILTKMKLPLLIV